LVQMLQRRDCDDYTREKLSLVSGQLQRIQTTLRELINFSRPASTVRTRFTLSDIVEEGLNIAKYYKRTKGRLIEALVPADLPPLHGVRDQLVQVFLNLVLNAVDATDNGGRITISAKNLPGIVRLEVSDNGSGIDPAHAGRIFEPYF